MSEVTVDADSVACLPPVEFYITQFMLVMQVVVGAGILTVTFYGG